MDFVSSQFVYFEGAVAKARVLGPMEPSMLKEQVAPFSDDDKLDWELVPCAATFVRAVN